MLYFTPNHLTHHTPNHTTCNIDFLNKPNVSTTPACLIIN